MEHIKVKVPLKACRRARHGFIGILIVFGQENYVNFEKRGFVIAGIFDINPSLKGLSVRGVQIRMMDELDEFVLNHDVDIAAFTMPKSKAPEIGEQVVSLGIKAIWNFANMDLNLPEDVIVENVHLSDSLMQLSYSIEQRRQNEE